MKNFDTLKQRKLKPKKEIIQTLLYFSKSLEVVKTREKKFLISKN